MEYILSSWRHPALRSGTTTPVSKKNYWFS